MLFHSFNFSLFHFRILHERDLFTENWHIDVEHIGIVAGVDLTDVHVWDVVIAVARL